MLEQVRYICTSQYVCTLCKCLTKLDTYALVNMCVLYANAWLN